MIVCDMALKILYWHYTYGPPDGSKLPRPDQRRATFHQGIQLVATQNLPNGGAVGVWGQLNKPDDHFPAKGGWSSTGSYLILLDENNVKICTINTSWPPTNKEFGQSTNVSMDYHCCPVN